MSSYLRIGWSNLCMQSCLPCGNLCSKCEISHWCEDDIFFLPVNILTVWCAGFLGSITHYHVSWSLTFLLSCTPKISHLCLMALQLMRTIMYWTIWLFKIKFTAVAAFQLITTNLTISSLQFCKTINYTMLSNRITWILSLIIFG